MSGRTSPSASVSYCFKQAGALRLIVTFTFFADGDTSESCGSDSESSGWDSDATVVDGPVPSVKRVRTS